MLEFTEDKHKVKVTWPASPQQERLTKKDVVAFSNDNYSLSNFSRATAPLLFHARDDDAERRANESVGLRPGGQSGCPANLPGARRSYYPQAAQQQILGRGLGG